MLIGRIILLFCCKFKKIAVGKLKTRCFLKSHIFFNIKSYKQQNSKKSTFVSLYLNLIRAAGLEELIGSSGSFEN